MSGIRVRAARAALSLLGPTLGCAPETAEPTRQGPPALVQQELLQAADASSEDLHVIVNFADARAVKRALLSLEGVEGTITRRYRHVPALAAQVTLSGLEALRELPGVTFIQVDNSGGGQLKEAVPAIGADRVLSMFGLTGKGVRVAVLDTGVATQHPDLRDAIVAQHCFTQRGCPPFRSYEGTSAEDDHGHGSNLAGIIASRGIVSSSGFAPDAELVAVKINDRNDRGQESDWVSGLDWVYDNLDELKVRIVNFSVGTSNIYPDDGTCARLHPALARAIDNLTNAGVSVFIASGNHGSGTLMPAPACHQGGAVVVGATYDSALGPQPPGAATYYERWGGFFARCGDRTTEFDQITCFTNSNGRLDLVAPGAAILSDSLRNGTEAYWGTSQSAPVAAGVAALMLQCDPDLTPAEIKDAMVSTGVMVTDAKNGRTFPSLRAYEAIRKVCRFDSSDPVDAGPMPPRDAGPFDGGTGADASMDPDRSTDDADTPEPRGDAGGLQGEGGPSGMQGMQGTGENTEPAARPAGNGCALRESASARSHAGILLVLAGIALRRRFGRAVDRLSQRGGGCRRNTGRVRVEDFTDPLEQSGRNEGLG